MTLLLDHPSHLLPCAQMLRVGDLLAALGDLHFTGPQTVAAINATVSGDVSVTLRPLAGGPALDVLVAPTALADLLPPF